MKRIMMMCAVLAGCGGALAGLGGGKTAKRQDVDDAIARKDYCYLEKVCYNEILAETPGLPNGALTSQVRQDACRAAEIQTVGPRPAGVTSHCDGTREAPAN